MISIYGAMTAERKSRIWDLWRKGIPMSSIARDIARLFIIKGGQAAFIKLVFAKNRFNGANADVPSRFYLRTQGLSG